MKLSLPADRNEKIKVLVMIALFTAALLYVIVQFVLVPFFSKMRTDRARITELDEQLWAADRDIQQITNNRTRNQQIIQQLLDISETQRHILRPSLGNYLLVAEAFLNQTAQEAGVEINNIRETSSTPPTFDPARARPANAFWPYAVSLSMRNGLHDLTRFVHVLQEKNPYLAIINLAITGGPANAPAQHQITMTIQWPVWMDPDHPNSLAAEMLADEEQYQ